MPDRKKHEGDFFDLDESVPALPSETPEDAAVPSATPAEPASEAVGGVAPADAATLTEALAKARAEKDELRHTLIHRQADFENFRKRIERERQEERKHAHARLIEELLPVLDSFDRALAAHADPDDEDYRKGFELIYRQLWDALARQGLERIEAEGKPFDPHQHQAVERVESEEIDDGTVLEVLQQGYKFRDKVLRPASVKVAAHPAGKESKNAKRVN